jgi:hypothetical protein
MTDHSAASKTDACSREWVFFFFLIYFFGGGFELDTGEYKWVFGLFLIWALFLFVK